MKTKWITITRYVDLDTGEILEEETVKQKICDKLKHTLLTGTTSQ